MDSDEEIAFSQIDLVNNGPHPELERMLAELDRPIASSETCSLSQGEPAPLKVNEERSAEYVSNLANQRELIAEFRAREEPKQERARVASWLRGKGLPPDYLSAGFWDLSREERDQELWFAAKEARLRREEPDRIRRLEQRERRRQERCISDPTPEESIGSWEMKNNARYARHARDYRRRKRKAHPAPPKPYFPIRKMTPTRDDLAYRLDSFRAWALGNGPSQRRLRGREHDIVRTWGILQILRMKYGREVSLAEMAAALQITKSSAQKRIAQLCRLEQDVWTTISA